MRTRLDTADYDIFRAIVTKMHSKIECDETPLEHLIAKMVPAEDVALALARVRIAIGLTDNVQIVLDAVVPRPPSKSAFTNDVFDGLHQISRRIYAGDPYDHAYLVQTVREAIGMEPSEALIEQIVRRMRSDPRVMAVRPLLKKAKRGEVF